MIVIAMKRLQTPFITNIERRVVQTPFTEHLARVSSGMYTNSRTSAIQWIDTISRFSQRDIGIFEQNVESSFMIVIPTFHPFRKLIDARARLRTLPLPSIERIGVSV